MDYEPQPINAPPRDVPAEEELLRSRKEIEIKRKKEDIRQRQLMEQQEKDNLKKMERMQQELKNKEFTYDNHGRIIMIEPIKFEKMPPPA
jgi:hypothetical protein